MNRPATWVVVATMVVAVLLAVVATSGEVPLAERAPSIPWKFGSSANPDPFEIPEQPTTPEREIEKITPLRLPRLVTVIAQAALIGALVTVAAAIFDLRVASPGPRLALPKAESDDFDVLDEFAESVGADAAEQLAALRDGKPRNAIVACWLRLEQSVVAAHVEHSPADTSAELTARVLSHFEIDEAAIATLSALYREARFSNHDMDEAARVQAIAALDAVHEGLRNRRVGSGVAS